jgi:hypothetical protein
LIIFLDARVQGADVYDGRRAFKGSESMRGPHSDEQLAGGRQKVTDESGGFCYENYYFPSPTYVLMLCTRERRLAVLNITVLI